MSGDPLISWCKVLSVSHLIHSYHDDKFVEGLGSMKYGPFHSNIPQGIPEKVLSSLYIYIYI